MPNRLLREGIVDSERINALSAEGERLFYRLLVVADDFGRMDARPAIVRARCFPLMETLSGEKIEKWLAELADKLLIVRYEVGGRPYLAVGRWEQRVRANAKHPPPPDDIWQTYVGHMSDNCQSIDGLGMGKGKGKGAARDPVALAAGEGETIASLTLNTGEVFDVRESQCAEWGRLFPAVDVPQELRGMEAWLKANPARRKTRTGILGFATSWLSKAQNRAPTAHVRRLGGVAPALQFRDSVDEHGRKRVAI